MDKEVKLIKYELTILKNQFDIDENNRVIKKLEKKVSVIACIQIVICTVQIMIIPLKLIPYDKLTNKVINVLTLVSFAFMFLSYFFSNIYYGERQDLEEKLNIYGALTSDYLKILEKIEIEEKN